MKALLFSLVFSISCLFALDQVSQSKVLSALVRDSQAIVRGKVLDIEYGDSRSYIYLKVFEATGVKPTDIQDTFVKVYFPVTKSDYKVESERGLNFDASEEIVVFLDKKNGKYWLHEDGLGKYRIEFIGGKKSLISSVIRRHKDGGEIPLSQFYKLVMGIKNVPLQWWENNQFVNKSFLEKSLMTTSIDKDDSGRGIASLGESETRTLSREPADVPQEEEAPTKSVFWLVALLAVVGGAARIVWKNS